MIATIISFCTNNTRFLGECIQRVTPFSSEVLVSVCDHFFDGEEENYALLEYLFAQFPHCTFVEFAYASYDPYHALDPAHPYWPRYRHGYGRSLPLYFLRTQPDYLLFVDTDELFDTERFVEWWKTNPAATDVALRLSTYLYFREACYVATTYPDLPLLVRSTSIEPKMLIHLDERSGVFQEIQGVKRRNVCGTDHRPLCHHYSWVQTKQELLKKTRTWNHHWERNWAQLIEEEYAREFSGRDFVYNYRYTKVPPVWDPLAQPLPPPLPKVTYEEHLDHLRSIPNVVRIEPKELFRLSLRREFDL